MPALFDTGFSVRQPTWHGLAKILQEYPGSWAEARREAGLLWNPVEEPAYEVVRWYDNGRADVKLIEGYKQIKRDDTGARLDISTENYEIIDHETMGEIFEALQLGGGTDIRYETMGSIEGGKRVWVMARVGDEFSLPGDPSPTQPYIALLNSHDGTAALRVIATSVRIVCANTWHLAEIDATARGSAFAFRHTKNWRNRVDDAKKALAATQDSIDRMMTQAREMLELKVTPAQSKSYIEQFAIHRVLANTVGKNKHTKIELSERMSQPRVEAALKNTIAQMTQILESRTCDGIRDSVWGLVQAGGEFADHYRTKADAESHFSRTVLADREPLKLAAVRLAREALTV